jgi:hypothetical protein
MFWFFSTPSSEGPSKKILSGYLPGGIEESHKETKNNWCPGQDSNQAPCRYKSETFVLEPASSVSSSLCIDVSSRVGHVFFSIKLL